VSALYATSLAHLNGVEKRRLPVSQARAADGQLLVVSRFADDVWDFWPYIPHENRPASSKRMGWSISLSDGTRLTDSCHEELLESAKSFIWSLYMTPLEGKKRPSMTSLIHRFYEMVPLLRWMVGKGLNRFRLLDGHTLDYVPVARLGSRTTIVSDSVVSARLAVVEALYQQRAKLTDAPQCHPWVGESAISLSGLRNVRKPKTDLIPESVVVPLARVAINYVLVRATQLLKARSLLDQASLAELHRHPVHAKIARTRVARSLGFQGQDDLSAELVRLRTACYIVINLFVGVRDSEMMSLSDCSLVPGKTRDGVEVLWLHGAIYKMGIRKKRWLAPPIAKAAVEVLIELTKPLRRALSEELIRLEADSCANQEAEGAQRLTVVRSSMGKLFLGLGPGRKEIQVLTNTTMNELLKQFCRHHDITGQGNKPYSLHSHQFRRTYAHYVARAELGDLLMLREHFGHWSLDMTLLYADGGADEYEADSELLEWVAEEKQVRQRDILGSIAASDTPVLSSADWLNTWRRKVRTASDKEKLVDAMSDTITLSGTGHSWCVGNAKGTGCGGLCVFEADMCVDCKFGIIAAEHLPVWRGIRDQQLEVLQMTDLGVSGQARAKMILLKAERVLQKLDWGGDAKAV
jgi:integrase